MAIVSLQSSDNYAEQLARVAREFSTVARPLVSAQPLPRALQEAARTAQEIRDGWIALAEPMQRMSERLYKDLAPLRRLAAILDEERRKYAAIEASGWLPHYTTPFVDIAEASDAETVRTLLGQYYETHWGSVREAIVRELDSYDVDDEAKATFIEALDAHERGMFRYAPRVLFAEIERLIRDEFYEGDPGAVITSQHQFTDAVGSLPPRAFGAKLPMLRLYLKLREHLYARVSTEQDAARAKADPVPNRHAALHGVVVYNTAQSSLNAIIMTEFILQSVTVIKRHAAEDAA